MPGLAGLVSAKTDILMARMDVVLDTLRYGRTVVAEYYQESNICLGCIHQGTDGQRALYQSDLVVILFFGYLTKPPIPLFADQSDPSEAAHYIHDLYLAQGEGMMNQLAGAFAFALWDKQTQTLLLASDHLGLRPIYYAEYNGIFRFASEIKGILADIAFPHRVNLAAIADFFHFSYVMGNKTFFEDIQLLPPASFLRYHNGSWTISNYWDVSYPENYSNHSDSWYDDLIFNALEAAVKRMVNPNIRYGLSLSGGLDSRWIAGFLSQIQPTSTSFTVGIPDSDDSYPAQQVATRTGLANTYWELSPSFVAELSELYSYIVDGMYNIFCTEEFPLSVQVGDYVDVSVGGFLGDCLFGHEVNPVSASIRRRDTKNYWLWRNKGSWLRQSLGDQVFGKSVNRDLESMAIDSLEKSIAQAPGEQGFQVLQYINLRNRQRRFINIAQLAKLPYVNIYHPLADLEVVQAALQLPPNQLMMERAYRRSMGKHFPELAEIPWTFTLTAPTVSVSAVILKKAVQLTLGQWLGKTPLGNLPLIRPRRYYTDYSRWTRDPLRGFIEETLLSSEANSTDLFNKDGLRTVVREHMEGKKDVTGFIGQALAIALWTRLFFTPSTPIRPSSIFVDSNNTKK